MEQREVVFQWDTTNLQPQIPYSLHAIASIDFDEIDSTNNVVVHENIHFSPQHPVLDFSYLPLGIGASLLFIALGILWYRRQHQRQPQGFNYFTKMTKGEIPMGYTVMISGDDGAGKSTLCQQLCSTYLTNTQPCVYITYDEFPQDVITHMDQFNWDPQTHIDDHLLTFIDCYSERAHTRNANNYVEQPFSLTDVGIAMTQKISECNTPPIIFLDSLVPLLTRLDPTTVIEFLDNQRAKIKGYKNLLVFTVGAGIIPAELEGQLTELVDVVIELNTSNKGNKNTKSIRINKFRGRTVHQQLVHFTIIPKQGIVFLVPRARVDSIN
jgi:archaellum biogenesis ATPase FlaH